jgi:hypothetical protein
MSLEIELSEERVQEIEDQIDDGMTVKEYILELLDHYDKEGFSVNPSS